MLSKYYPDIVQILSKYCPNIIEMNSVNVQILSSSKKFCLVKTVLMF